MLRIRTAVFCLAALLAACGTFQPQGPATGRLRPEHWIRFKAGDAQSLNRDASGTWSGSGSLVYRSPLGEPNEAHNITCQVALHGEGASIRLVAFSNGQLGGGVSVVVARAGQNLRVALADGEGLVRHSVTVPSPNLDQPLALSVDVHNGVKPSRVLAWVGAAEGPPLALAFDSGSLSGDAWKAQGASSSLGYELLRADLFSVTVGGPQAK